ncbi:hypothetical protein [Paraburkholderia sp. RL17-373-BIF-A]|uniref:hypothetical protein n=1 Tax=Paraburkholderia sp. RL17-373-BIF-A TaxID=3031629 RepID=UPI0038BD9147
MFRIFGVQVVVGIAFLFVVWLRNRKDFPLRLSNLALGIVCSLAILMGNAVLQFAT